VCCDGIARAGITGSWLRQMGFPNVSVLDGGTTAWTATVAARVRRRRAEPWGLRGARRDPDDRRRMEIVDLLRTPGPPQVIYVGTKPRVRRLATFLGARWVPRGWLEPRIEALVPDWTEPIVVTDEDAVDAFLAAATLRQIGYHDVSVLAGGMRGWRASGGAIETGLSGVMEPPDERAAGRPGAQLRRHDRVPCAGRKRSAPSTRPLNPLAFRLHGAIAPRRNCSVLQVGWCADSP